MKNLFSRESIIGACVLIALAVLFFGIEYLKGVSIFKPSNYYYAVYTDVDGLTVSAPVTVNGFKIGQVDNVELMYDRPGNVLVTISLEKKFRLPVNSKATIESDLLGTASIKLDMAQGSVFYNPGDTIPGAEASGMMGEISSKILPGVSDIIPKVDTLLTSVNTVVSNPALASTLTRLESISASLESTMASIKSSVALLPDAMNDITAITASIKTISDDMTTLSSTLANAPVDSTINNLNRISSDLAQLTASLKSQESTIGKALHDSELYDNLTRATASLDSLFSDIIKNPKRYINIKLL